MALRAALAAEARRRGLDRSAQLQARREEAAAGLRAEYALSQRLARRAAAVPESELAAFFEQNKARYQTLRTMALRVLLLDIEAGEHPWLTLERAEALAERIRAGEDFAELARRLSRHYSARDGGLVAADLTDFGLGLRVQSRARNRNIIEDLAIGEISDPFVAEVHDPDELRFIRTGVYLVRVEGRTPPVQAEFRDVLEAVRANYLRRHYQELLAAEREEALAAAELVVHEERLPPL